MNIRITHKIQDAQIIWAVYQLMTRSNNITKEKVIIYLKEQVELFGSDNSSLMGENYPEVDAIYHEAKEWAERKFEI